jgi:hypothetical protein
VSRVAAPESPAALLAEYTGAIGENAPLTIMAAKRHHRRDPQALARGSIWP